MGFCLGQILTLTKLGAEPFSLNTAKAKPVAKIFCTSLSSSWALWLSPPSSRFPQPEPNVTIG